MRLPIISPATAMMLTNTVKTMNTVSTRSYVVVAASSVAARDKPELIPEHQQVEHNGGKHENDVRATALAKFADDVIMYLAEQFNSSVCGGQADGYGVVGMGDKHTPLPGEYYASTCPGWPRRLRRRGARSR